MIENEEKRALRDMQRDREENLYGAADIAAAVGRIADAIVRDFRRDGGGFALIGIYKQGVPLAERLIRAVEERGGGRPELAKLDISMYRDDVGLRSGLPLIRETVIPFNMENKRVILVDDVLSSGRSIRAALDAVTDYGRPALIRLAVLVDRGMQEYPIRADYVGLRVDVPIGRRIRVDFVENDGVDAILAVPWRRDAAPQPADALT